MSGTPLIKAVLKTVPYRVELSDDQGHAWAADEPLEAGGGNAGPTPESLVLASLGACTAITVKMVAARRQWPLDEVRVELQLNPAGKPDSGNDIVRRIEHHTGTCCCSFHPLS